MKNKLQNLSRRNFLSVSGTAAAALAAQAVKHTSVAALAANEAAAQASPAKAMKKYPIGLELYAVRTELARDLPNTLQTVAQMGYEVVEFYAPYFQWTMSYAKEVRTRMDDLGLRCYSTPFHGTGSRRRCSRAVTNVGQAKAGVRSIRRMCETRNRTIQDETNP